MTKTYTIATGNKHSTQVASEILDNGGNAYDAIIAALFMSFVCEPLLSSPGGGGYLLAHPNNQSPMVFDFFAQTPFEINNKTKDFFPIQGDFGSTSQEFHIGMASVATPGIPAGIFAIHNQLGRMPLVECAHSAISKAKKGFVVDKHLAEVINILSPIIDSSCYAKSIFTNAKKQLLSNGEILINQHLSDFLQELATQPMDWFYFDTPAQSIVHDMRHNNGLLTAQDFENYQVEIRKPLIKNIHDWKIITNAAPTTGGLLITKQLQHAHENLKANNNDKIIQAMKYADSLKNKQQLQVSKGTTHMSIIDQDNNVASMTVSNGEGSGYVAPFSGFMLNNFLGEEDINTQGFFNFQNNTRMASMMSPTILENKKNKFALGTGGSNRIKTALFQVIWNMIANNKTLKQSVDMPRFHYEKGVLDIEKGVMINDTEKWQKTCNKINNWDKRSLYFGGINAVQKGDADFAIGDSRRNGVGLVKMVNQ